MKIAIVSDIHANADALRRALADARSCGAEKIACLGDIVGYGPLPAETVRLVKENCFDAIAGNHDDAVSGRTDKSDFTDLAGDAVGRHRKALSQDDVAWLRALPHKIRLSGEAVATHGDITDPAKFYYVENEDDAQANFAACDERIVFVGHTHIPCIFVTGHSGNVYRTEPQDFTIEDGKRYIVNPGSVGYPRVADGTCVSTYAIYDTAERTVSFRRLAFSVSSVMQRGRPRRNGLPIALALGAAALAAALALSLPRGDASPAPAEEMRIAAKTFPLPPGTKRYVEPELKLEKGSDPVVLRITFKDASGAELSVETRSVKRSLASPIKVPDGAVDAEAVLLKTKSSDKPVLKSFAPKAAAK